MIYILLITGLLLLLGIIYLIFFIFKKIGYPKIGKIISLSLIIILLYLIFVTVFDDYLFTRNDAKKLLKEQNIVLEDNFEIIKNESMTAIGHYYMTFTAKISTTDKNRIISEIKKSKNFTTNDVSIESIVHEKKIDTYNGEKIVLNHETKLFFIRELFEPNGDGYSPTWTITKIDKTKNELTFEDIDE